MTEITLRRHHAILGSKDAEPPLQLPWIGLTLRQILDEHCGDIGAPEDIRVIIGGAEVPLERWDEPVAANADLTVAPRPRGGIGEAIVAGIIVSIIAAGINLLLKKLFPVKRGTLERGDETSQTYSFTLRTDYQPGGPVPMILGQHDTSLRVIGTSVEPDSSGNEVLTMVAVIGVGRIDSVGGVSGGDAGETGLLGSIIGQQLTPNLLPGDVRVNGNVLENSTGTTPGAEMVLRMGEQEQAPMPFGFSEAKGSKQVGAALEDLDSSGSGRITASNVSNLAVNIRFTQGLYELDASGNVIPFVDRTGGGSTPGLLFRCEYRVDGGAWIPAVTATGEFRVTSPAQPRTPFTFQFGFPPLVQPGVLADGDIDVRVTRLSQRGDPDQVAASSFTQIVYSVSSGFSWGGWAVMGMRFIGSEKVQGARPDVRVNAKGLVVRVWDSVNNWSSNTWAVPAAPHNFHLHPPGRNPAWLLIAFLLHPSGLGEYIDEADLDLQTFRDLADYCDQEISAGVPRFQCDLVLDRQLEAMDAINQILGTCFAALVFRGDKIAVVYSYRDAHGSKPASATFANGEWTINYVQGFNSANVRKYRRSRVSPRFRATVIEAHFANGAIGYEADYVTQEDPNAEGFNLATPVLNADGVRKEPVRYTGVTRAAQCRYMALLQHNINRLARWSFTFEVAAEAIMCELGDLVYVQANTTKAMPLNSAAPSSITEAERDSFGVRLADGFSGSSTSVELDRDVTIPANQAWSIFVVVEESGKPKVVEGLIPSDPSERTITAGTAIEIKDPANPANALSINYRAGAAVAFGPQHRTVIPCEVVGLELREKFVIQVQLVEWRPEMFDVDTNLVLAGATAGGDEERPAATSPLAPGFESIEDDDDSADDLRLQRVEDIQVYPTGNPGEQAVVWEAPINTANRTSRVYARQSSSHPFQLIGEVQGRELRTHALGAGETWDLAVAIQDGLGSFTLSEESLVKRVTTEEFPGIQVPGPTALEATVLAEGVLFEWPAVDPAVIRYYEIRAGIEWFGAEVITRTRDSQFFYRGGPATFERKYFIRARHVSGQWSPVAESPVVTMGVPSQYTLVAGTPIADLVVGAAGTHDGTEWDATDGLRLQAGKYHGTYTMNEVDGVVVNGYWWSAYVDAQGRDNRTVDEVLELVGSGEGYFRTVEGRDTSPGNPGVDMDLLVDDLTMTVDELAEDQDQLVHGRRGTVGHVVRVKLEVRYHDNVSWGDWMPHVSEKRSARRIQARIRLDRADLEHEVFAKNLQITLGT